MQILDAVIDALHHNSVLSLRRGGFDALPVIFELAVSPHGAQLPEVPAVVQANCVTMLPPPLPLPEQQCWSMAAGAVAALGHDWLALPVVLLAGPLPAPLSVLTKDTTCIVPCKDP